MSAAAHLDLMQAVIDAARPLARCSSYWHSDPNDPRALRIDCADDQCTNSTHTRWVRCDRREHDLAEALAALDAETSDGGEGT